MQMITTIGLDIAKSVFQVHGVDAGGCPACLLNIAKRSLPKLILRGVGLASNDAVG